MIARNIAHAAVLAGHSVLLVTASQLLLDLSAQDSARALERRFRHYCRPTLLCIDEIGYLSYDARNADLLFQIIQPPLRTQERRDDHQPRLQRLADHLSQRHLRHRPDRRNKAEHAALPETKRVAGSSLSSSSRSQYRGCPPPLEPAAEIHRVSSIRVTAAAVTAAGWVAGAGAGADAAGG